MAVLHINKNNFEQEVLNTNQKVLLDFWAPWCGPCRLLGPTLDAIANERDDVKVCKVNVDEEEELAREFGIVSIPTMFVIHNGEVLNELLGAQPKAKILAALLNINARPEGRAYSQLSCSCSNRL